MTQIEQIKAEIERRMANNHQDATESGSGAFYEDKELLSFIDSLPEEGIEDLEEEVREYIANNGYDGLDTEMEVQSIASYFANWQRENLMKEAIELKVKVDAGGYPYIDVTELYDYDKNIPLAKAGDKVKIIIIKEDEQ